MKPLSESIAILCRAAVQLAPTVTGEMMYMPGGMQSITPCEGGHEDGTPLRVMVDAAGAAELERQRAAIVAKGKAPYFDFNHENGPASFWPKAFFWQDSPEPGIYCRGEWTSTGRASVEGKEWRQFSPVFHVNNKSANPARIVCREWAKPNMGALINDPAFHSILPLWAKDAVGAQSNTNPNQTDMTPEELAALQAKNKELQTELDALKAKEAALKLQGNTDALIAGELRAKEMELKSTSSELELASLKAKNKSQGDAIAARNKADAEAEVKAAVARGAILAKDQKTQDTLIKAATEDPGYLDVIKAMQGNAAMSGRITPPASVVAAQGRSSIVVGAESARALFGELAAICAKNASIPVGKHMGPDKGRLALQAGSFYKRELATRIDDWQDMPFGEAIAAADYDDPNNMLGTLSGTLVLQRVLELFTYTYPELLSVFTDFSDAPAQFNQTETTRIIVKPAVQTYDASLQTDGRPGGWVTASPAITSDVSVTLNKHVGIPIVFGQDILSATARQLFSEMAPAATSALGEYFVNMITALMTSANFPVYGFNSFSGGATTNGSMACTCTSTVGMAVGEKITGTGIPANTRIAGIQGATAFTLNTPATATGEGLTFSTAQSVPTPYLNATPAPAYAQAVADFNMASLDNIGAAFDNAEVPQNNRMIWLNASYYARLNQDPNLALFFAALKSPDVITKGQLPPDLRNFAPWKAPYFPTTANGVGFAGHKTSIIAKSRLPVDFTKALNTMIPGSVTTVTDPATKLSCLLFQYVDLKRGFAEWRLETMLGASTGDPRGGMLLTSQ